jgi:general secretion pathway protein H
MTSRSDFAAGFTLIEVTIVIAVVALALSLVSIRSSPIGPAVQARAVAQELSGALRTARGEAIANNRGIAFTLDIARRTYRWGRQPPRDLPRDVSLSVLTTQTGTGAAEIRFYPDGSSSGGRLTIDGAGVVWWVGIDWISGRVSVVKKGT